KLTIAYAGCVRVVTTTLQSLSRSWNCSHALRRLRGGVIPSSRKRCCVSAISSWISYRGRPAVEPVISTCFLANSSYLSISFAMRAEWCPGRCCCSTCGIFISTPQPTSSMSMLDVSVAKSMTASLTRSFIQFAVLGTASVRLAETLRSSTFKLALIAIGLFGAIVLALFGYVYFSTISYVRGRLDSALVAEQLVLQDAYDSGGRGGLLAIIRQRTGDEAFRDNAYSLAQPTDHFVACKLEARPSGGMGTGACEAFPGAGEGFRGPAWKAEPTQRTALRTVLMTFPNGDHLLLGKSANDLEAYTRNVKTGFIVGIALICILASMAGVLVTRRTVGR